MIILTHIGYQYQIGWGQIKSGIVRGADCISQFG